jgi:hypothetical protein
LIGAAGAVEKLLRMLRIKTAVQLEAGKIGRLKKRKKFKISG